MGREGTRGWAPAGKGARRKLTCEVFEKLVLHPQVPRDDFCWRGKKLITALPERSISFTWSLPNGKETYWRVCVPKFLRPNKAGQSPRARWRAQRGLVSGTRFPLKSIKRHLTSLYPRDRDNDHQVTR